MERRAGRHHRPGGPLAGEVLVDATCRPRGPVGIHPGTQVRFAGSDRLHTGRDPGHSELDIQENLSSRRLSECSGKVVDKVSFEAQTPGQWFRMDHPQPGAPKPHRGARQQL